MKDSIYNRIITLAYLHRYGWMIIMAITVAVTRKLYWAGVFFIMFGIWTFIGYRLRWRHIGCSWQNAYRRSVNPYNIRWSEVSKDAIPISLMFFVMGVCFLWVFTRTV